MGTYTEVQPAELVGMTIQYAEFNDDGELVLRCQDYRGVMHSFVEEGGLLYRVEAGQ